MLLRVPNFQEGPEIARYALVPPPPSDPPTVEDAAAAIHLAKDLLVHHGYKKVSARTLVDAEVYKTNVINALLDRNEVVEIITEQLQDTLKGVVDKSLQPLRDETRALRPLLENVQDIQKTLQSDVDKINKRLENIEADMKRLRLEQGLARRITAYQWNNTLGPSPVVPLQVVPFENGEDPTCAPHNLPPLTNQEAFDSLTANQRERYYSLYYPNGDAPNRSRKEKIIEATGWRAPPLDPRRLP